MISGILNGKGGAKKRTFMNDDDVCNRTENGLHERNAAVLVMFVKNW